MRINFSAKPCVEKKEKLIWFIIPVVLIIVASIINVSIFAYYRVLNSSSHTKIEALRDKKEGYNKKIFLAISKLKRIKYRDFKKQYTFFNAIVKKKQLSWVDIFSEFENILPADVKLSMISPKVEYSKVLLSISAEAKSKDAELRFLDKLEKSNKFHHPFIEYESIDNITGNIKFSVSVEYGKVR